MVNCIKFIVKEFSIDISMQFGIDKCCALNVLKGKKQYTFQMQNK